MDLPFQIIINDEPEGDEYAACRALTKNAKEENVQYVMDQVKQEPDENVREHYGTPMKLISDRNPELMRKLEGDKQMGDVLMDILKDRIDEKIQLAVEEAKAENQAEIEEWKAKYRALEAENQKLMKENKEKAFYMHNLVKSIPTGAVKRNDPEKGLGGSITHHFSPWAKWWVIDYHICTIIVGLSMFFIFSQVNLYL